MKHENEQERLAEAALKRMFAGGRGGLARGMDYVLLRVLLLLGAYLYFMGAVGRALPAALLSAIFLALCMVLLRILREVRYGRFSRRETERLRGVLLLDRLLLLTPGERKALCGPLCEAGEQPVLPPCAGPAGPDAILAALRERRGKGRVALFAMGGYTREAAALLLRMGEQVRPMDPARLTSAAREAGMLPGDGEVRAYLAALAGAERAEGKRRRTLRLDGAYGKKYVLTGLLLLGLSFFTRYALYYRMLAGLSMSIGTLVLLRRPERGGGRGGGYPFGG